MGLGSASPELSLLSIKKGHRNVPLREILLHALQEMYKTVRRQWIDLNFFLKEINLTEENC